MLENVNVAIFRIKKQTSLSLELKSTDLQTAQLII
jgi:hypothetical protein